MLMLPQCRQQGRKAALLSSVVFCFSKPEWFEGWRHSSLAEEVAEEVAVRMAPAQRHEATLIHLVPFRSTYPELVVVVVVAAAAAEETGVFDQD